MSLIKPQLLITSWHPVGRRQFGSSIHTTAVQQRRMCEPLFVVDFVLNRFLFAMKPNKCVVIADTAAAIEYDCCLTSFKSKRRLF